MLSFLRVSTKAFFKRARLQPATFAKIIRAKQICLKNGVYLAFGLFLVGCASAPSPEFHTTFTTHIFENGNKQFTLRLVNQVEHSKNRDRPPRPQGEPPQPPVAGRAGGFWRPGRLGKMFSPENIKTHALIKRDQILAENHYCREGYWLIDEQFQGPAITLKGECNDLAAGDETARFKNLRSNTIRASDFKGRLAPPSQGNQAQ